MATDAQTLLTQANCYQCFASNPYSLALMELALTLNWNQGQAPAFPCGAPSNTILLSGANVGEQNTYYTTQDGGSTWNADNGDVISFDPIAGIYTTHTNGGLAAYQSTSAQFPCTWTVFLGSAPAPTGQYIDTSHMLLSVPFGNPVLDINGNPVLVP
jgi:hypothetical protein